MCREVMLNDGFSKRIPMPFGIPRYGCFPRVTGKQPVPSVPILPGARLQHSQQLPMRGSPQAGTRGAQLHALHRLRPVAQHTSGTPALNPNLRDPSPLDLCAQMSRRHLKAAPPASTPVPMLPRTFPVSVERTSVLSSRARTMSSSPSCSCLADV